MTTKRFKFLRSQACVSFVLIVATTCVYGAPQHQAALDLAPPELATHTATNSGDWSSPSTWLNSLLPTEDAAIYVPAGVTVTVDIVDSNTYATIRADGTLRFATDRDTQLRVDTLVTSQTSRFEMGTSTMPIASGFSASLIIADRGPIDRAYDPRGLSRGALFLGTTEIHGAAKTSWTTAEINPMAGDQTLTLDSNPQGWKQGDLIVVAGTNIDATGEDERTIASINGNVITLNQALTHNHLPPASDLKIHVVNLTRNAFIQSESSIVDRRGHVMLMHQMDDQFSYTGFYDLGRTDKSVPLNPAELDDGELVPGTGTNVPGRYGLHFHLQGTNASSNPQHVVGCAMVGTPGWGFVNHSSNANFIDNVCYSAYGAAFYTEAGDEIGSFVNNVAVKTHGSGLPPREHGNGEDFGHSGDGFWLQGGSGITLRNNTAAGSTGSGLIIFGVEFPFLEEAPIRFLAENLPDPSYANGATEILVGMNWLREVKGNTAYGSKVGFQMYYHRSPVNMDLPGMEQEICNYQWDFPKSIIEDTTAWNCMTGLKALYNEGVHYKNVRLVNSPDQIGEIGMDVFNRYNQGEHLYEDLDIRGFVTGLIPAPSGTVIVEGGVFANEINIYTEYPIQNHRYLNIRGEIQFEDYPNLDSAPDIVVAGELEELNANGNSFLYFDSITLNFGSFSGEQLYRPEQAGDFVPYTTAPDDDGVNFPQEYIGLSNEEMQTQFGHSLAGVILPTDSFDGIAMGIDGYIGPPSEPPSNLIERLFIGPRVEYCVGEVLLGDINLDGTINLLDVDPFVVLLSSGQFQVEADINQDGAIDLLDVQPFVDLLTNGS